MTKVLIKTGSESHSTSRASVTAKFVGGEHDGQMMYAVKKYVTNTHWDDSNDKHKTWVETIFDLPNGTKFAVIGKGQTGPGGADKHSFHKVFIVDSEAKVLDTTIDVGLRNTDLKGRIVIVEDVIASRKQKEESSRTEGF